jgi:adaptin ear-binding coat-associated protein 1/2
VEHRAADWDVNKFLWTGRLRITAQGPRLFLRFEQPNGAGVVCWSRRCADADVAGGPGDLFAVCPYDPKGNAVESVLDSSRYFVVRLENENGAALLATCP